MKFSTRIVTIGTAALLGTIGAALPASAGSQLSASHSQVAAAKKVAPSSVPVAGTLADGTAFTGALSNLTASLSDGAMQLTGTLTGTGLPTGGTEFTAPISALDTVGCDVITLDLGPLHLDVLGLVIDLAPVNLDVTAVPGAGNLLGNLVCAIAGLLDRGGPLTGILALLNRLLTGLGL